MLRQLLLAIASLLAASAAVSAHEPEAPTCSLKLELIERNTSEPLPGMVRVGSRDGQPLRPPELVNRGQGIDKGPIAEWSVLTQATTVTVPAEPLSIQALAGLETDLATQKSICRASGSAELQIPLDRFAHARRDGYVAGNTHLHLKQLSQAQADRYLSEVPLADGLDVVFISYLERAEARPRVHEQQVHARRTGRGCRTATCTSDMARSTGTTSAPTAKATGTSCCSTSPTSSSR